MLIVKHFRDQRTTIVVKLYGLATGFEPVALVVSGLLFSLVQGWSVHLSLFS